jgi:hypothetical protein
MHPSNALRRWVHTRNRVTLLSGCSSLNLLAASDGHTGVTLYLVDPATAVSPTVLQVCCLLCDGICVGLCRRRTSDLFVRVNVRVLHMLVSWGS